MKPTLKTAWIWPVPDGVNGLRLDCDNLRLHWSDQMGCACGGSSAEQSFATYAAHGVPGLITPPPAEILSELHATISWLTTQQS